MQNLKESNRKETVDTMETVLFTNLKLEAFTRIPFHMVSKQIALIASTHGLNVAVSCDGRYFKANFNDFKKAKQMFFNAVMYN